MKIELEVDAKAFEELVKGTIENLSEEAKLEIVREGIVKALGNADSLAYVLNTSRYYDNGRENVRDIVKAAAEKIDLSPMFEDVKNAIMAYVKEHKGDLAKEYLMSRFTDGLMYTFYGNEGFRSMIQSEIYNFMSNHNNQQ